MSRYRVWCPETQYEEGDAIVVEACDPAMAAEAWAERSDYQSAEYAIVGGSEAVVAVKDEAGTEHRFRVTGESVAVYHARQITVAHRRTA